MSIIFVLILRLQLTIHEIYMHRCLELALSGAGYTAPNPIVGAVLVHDGKIIGEGYHEHFGKPHAEVNCISSVAKEDEDKIPHSVLYVSLEPCAHFGKTPPCTDLIISKKIPEVVIGCRDPFEEVNGKGMERLTASGVRVVYGILEDECRKINKRFLTFHQQHRPYIILKWAETADGMIAGKATDRMHISGEVTNRLVHKWRSEEASILVGTNTALLDDPELTTRYWSGPSPVRLVIDRDLKLPLTWKIFNSKQRTVIFNSIKQEEQDKLIYYQVAEDVSLVHQVVNALYRMKIQSVMVEGGARLLQSFIDEGMWDEARVIVNEKLKINNGLAGPQLKRMNADEDINIGSDRVRVYLNK